MKVSTNSVRDLIGHYHVNGAGALILRDMTDGETVRISQYTATHQRIMVDTKDVDDEGLSWTPIYKGDSITLQF